MSHSDKTRQDDQPAFVLHTYPFRETSLIAEVFSRSCGRVALVARGARRPRSALRGMLLAFQPLSLSWHGRSELRTLRQAERQGGLLHLQGRALLCGFYLNELLLKLLPRDDPHERLYDAYREALGELAAEREHAATLRRFEKHLLKELGYALNLSHEAHGGAPLEAGRSYAYAAERGALPLEHGMAPRNGVELRGKTLLDMAQDDYRDPVTLRQSKILMRMLIAHCLGGQVLHTRQLLKDLQNR